MSNEPADEDGATVELTGAYVPGETNPHEPDGTQSPAKQSTLNRDQPDPEATGAFNQVGTGHPAGRPAATDWHVATSDFQPGQTVEAVASSSPPGARPGNERARCGRYVLKNFHARGGMGEIWLAEDPAIGRSVALKRMLGRRPDRQDRFRVEAQVTGQLEHPGIVPVHELGTNEEGQPYYTMKFVHGRTLKKVIEEYHQAKKDVVGREVERVRLLQIFVSLCQTVGYAHSRGVLHRDLKPENVMLGSFGETLLLDWGIAKVMGQPEEVSQDKDASFVHLHGPGEGTEGTRDGTIMGSPSYMAPEVAAGLNQEVDQRSDVYLLGATLYEMLTGRLPREGATAMEIITKAQRLPPVPPRKINPEITRPLEAICLKAMATKKEDRYQTALALADDIQRFVAGEPVSAYREGVPARAWRWAKRHRKALTWSAGAAVLASLLLFGVAKIREAEQQKREAQRESERLKMVEQARGDLKEFRRLADEARFYAATTDAVSENSPYFDPREGETRMKAALTLAKNWEPTLEALPLPEERESVKKELYDLLLLLAQAKTQPTAGAGAAKETLSLLEEAGQMREPSRSYFRFRARAHEQLGDGKMAADDARQAKNARTQTTSLDHFLLGEQYRKETSDQPKTQTRRKAWQPDPRQMDKAIEQYRLALSIDPDHYWSHFQLGRCYLGLGKYAEAVEALGACVALRPEIPWGYSVRGFALARQKRYREAERDLNRAVELSPDSRPPRLNRGVVYWNQNKDAEALADFAAVLLPPREKRLTEAAYYRGQLYLQQGEVKKALEDFNLVVAERPAFRPVFVLRARIHIAQGNNSRGLDDLDAYLAEGPAVDRDSREARARRGHLLRLLYSDLPLEQRQKPSGQALATLAVAQLKEAAGLGMRSAELFDDLGAMMEFAGQTDEAIRAYSQGLKISPRDVKLLNKRGWAYEGVNDHVKSKADFAAVVRIAPENAEGHSGLGYVRALEKRLPEAQREADLALLHGADDYLILHNVACIYTSLANVQEKQAGAYQEVAIALLRRAVQVWKRGGTGPSEVELIKGDPTFKPLHDRADFKKLLLEGAG